MSNNPQNLNSRMQEDSIAIQERNEPRQGAQNVAGREGREGIENLPEKEGREGIENIPEKAGGTIPGQQNRDVRENNPQRTNPQAGYEGQNRPSNPELPLQRGQGEQTRQRTGGDE